MAKLLKYDWRLGAAFGLSAMYGFPFSLMIPEQVIDSFELSEEQHKLLYDTIVPKMVIAGFTSVTVCSVVIAGLVIPFAF